MQRIISVLAILVLFSTALYAQSKCFELDQKYGFRDVRFEMPINAFNGLVAPIEEGKDVKIYIRPNDKLSVGNAQLNKIVYQFYKGKLHIVALYCDERNAGALLYSLEQAYGSGEKSIPGISSWYGQRVRMDYFSFNQENGYAWVCISSIKIDDKIRADEKQKARDDF
ncbi:MAG: hypothetical protein EOO61_17025 [Hymenobacter sp.]|nr:MAG: hypothetical protein EOO61_17025 [Hymenobacter sp.]